MNAKQLFKIRTYLAMQNTAETNAIVEKVDCVEKMKIEIADTLQLAKSQLTAIQNAVEDSTKEEIYMDSVYALEDISNGGFEAFYTNRKELNNFLDTLINLHGGLTTFMEKVNKAFVAEE